MSEPSIRDLLLALDDDIAVDPDVDQRLRARLDGELRIRPTSSASAVGGRSEPDERIEFTLVETTEQPSLDRIQTPDRRRRSFVLAAVACLVALLGATLLATTISRSADAPADFHTEDEPRPEGGRSFADGRLEQTPIGTESGGNPYRIAVGDHVWTMSLDGALTRRDPATTEATAQLTIPDSSRIAASGDVVWVADAGSGRVLRVDAETAEVVAAVPTGIRIAGPVWPSGGLGMSGGRARDFARIGNIDASTQWVWVADQDGRVLRIDPRSNEVVEEFDVPIGADLVRAEGEYLLVVDREHGAILVLDAATGAEVLPVRPAARYVGADLHGGAVYVHEPDTGAVSRIDLVTGVEIASDSLGSSPYIDGRPQWPPIIAVSDSGVLAVTDNGLHVLDPDTLTELDRRDEIDVRSGEMTIDTEGTAWIAQFYGSNLARLEPVEP